jgi:hypothetical protein
MIDLFGINAQDVGSPGDFPLRILDIKAKFSGTQKHPGSRADSVYPGVFAGKVTCSFEIEFEVELTDTIRGQLESFDVFYRLPCGEIFRPTINTKDRGIQFNRSHGTFKLAIETDSYGWAEFVMLSSRPPPIRSSQYDRRMKDNLRKVYLYCDSLKYR